MEALRYKSGTGPAEVNIPEVGVVRRGGTIDVPDEMAEALVKDRPDEWEYVNEPATVAVEDTADEEEE